MKLIVGLGNPGVKYKNNRHNVGFMVIDALARKLQNSKTPSFKKSKKGKLQYFWKGLNGGKIELIKPLNFMNNSGYSVYYAYKKHSLSPSELFVVHDDLDIKLGEYKIQKGKGPREHKGLLSIYKGLDTRDFWHVRVGVDNRDPEMKIAGETYVLQNFTKVEKEILKPVIDRIIKDLTRNI